MCALPLMRVPPHDPDQPCEPGDSPSRYPKRTKGPERNTFEAPGRALQVGSLSQVIEPELQIRTSGAIAPR